MGAFKIAFSPYADRDLEQIVGYVARDNPAAADKLGRKLVDRALSLAAAENAQMGSRLRNRPDVRKLVEGNYVIFYRVFAEQNKVRILRFWHAAQYPDRLRLGR